MFVSNIPFVITYGREIGLIVVEFMPNRMAKQLVCNLRRIIPLYSRADIAIQPTLMDMELNKVAPELPKTQVLHQNMWLKLKKESKL